MSATSDSRKIKLSSSLDDSQKKQKNVKSEGDLYFCMVYISENWGGLPTMHAARIDPDKKGLVGKLMDTFKGWDGYEFYFECYTQDELKSASKFKIIFDLVVDEPLTSLDYDKIQKLLDSDDKYPTINYMVNVGTKLGPTRFDVEE